MAHLLYGSICLSDIPREQMRKVKLQDGTEKIFLNVSVIERKEESKFGHSHFISCAPKKEERRTDVSDGYYIIGDLRTYAPKPATPTPEEIESAPVVQPDDDLPF